MSCEPKLTESELLRHFEWKFKYYHMYCIYFKYENLFMVPNYAYNNACTENFIHW